GKCNKLYLHWVDDKDNCAIWEVAVVLPGNLICMGRLYITMLCPPALEENDSLTPHDGSASAMAAGLLVNLDLEVPDTFRPPPAPLPYDVVLGCPQSTDSESFRETISGGSFETLPTCEDLEESDCKTQSSSLLLSPRKSEVSKLTEPKELLTEEEDACPICLEGTVLSLSKALIASSASLQYLITMFASDCLSMTQRIQNLSQNVNIIFTFHAFWSGWKEVTPAPYAIRFAFFKLLLIVADYPAQEMIFDQTFDQ
ncbi:hypothetical protein QQP08_003726, partial [Theobroma cacao]